MSSLNIFPTEILEWITSVMTTSQQVRLWQCGDRILNYKLKNGGLKRTSLLWSGSTWMPWPRSYFTTHNGLVEVEWGMDIGTSLCPTLELNLLPKTLQRLDLACTDVFILLRKQNVNMKDMLPTLQLLRLSGHSLREENLKNLPSNLIELHVASDNSNIKSCRIFGELPRHIARLTLTFNIVDQSELENDLPNQLIFLDIYSLECNFNWFSKLPKSLKTLNMTFKHLDPDWHTLPPQLEELRLGSIPKSVLPQLPQSLKTLKIDSLDDFSAGDELVSLLPKNLTKCALPSGNIDHNGLRQVPACLTDFDVRVSAAHPDLLSFFHPDSTKIRIGLHPPYSDRLNIFPFPTKLESLELYYIDDDICAMLPPGLRELRIENGLITTKGASKLPKSLTSLTTRFVIFNDKQSMSYLQHISNLSLLCEDTERDQFDDWIYSFLPSTSSRTSSSHGCLSTSTDINHFNQHLTSLAVLNINLFGIDERLFKKPFFDALPKFINLKSLYISQFEEISSDWLCSSPKNVTNLSISSLTSFPTATQLSTLPQCLIFLDLSVNCEESGCDWTDETLQSLPRSLQLFSTNFSIPKLTSRMYEYIPSTLQKFTVRHGDIFFNDPLNRLYG